MSIVLTFNDQYLDKTPNKDPRQPGERYRMRCWHETANGSGNPHSTLKWNLKASVKSSYDVLIARDGEIWRYVDWKVWNSWSEGLSSYTLNGEVLGSTALGRACLGIELDGANDGVMKATEPQIEAAARFAIYTFETEGIPLDRKHDVTHTQIAPGRKSDPRGYTIEQVYEAIRDLTIPPLPDWLKLWGGMAPYVDREHWGIPTRWREEGARWGKALTDEFTDPTGVQVQRFEKAVVTWTAAGGVRIWEERD